MAETKDKVPTVAHNHDEQVLITNSHIEEDNEREVERQQEWLDKQQALADDVDKRANFNVVVEDFDGEGDAARYETLTAVVVYGRSGSARYEVVEGDTNLRIVYEGSSKEATKKEKKEAEKAEGVS